VADGVGARAGLQTAMVHGRRCFAIGAWCQRQARQAPIPDTNHQQPLTMNHLSVVPARSSSHRAESSPSPGQPQWFMVGGNSLSVPGGNVWGRPLAPNPSTTHQPPTVIRGRCPVATSGVGRWPRTRTPRTIHQQPLTMNHLSVVPARSSSHRAARAPTPPPHHAQTPAATPHSPPSSAAPASTPSSASAPRRTP
jgi:hypothetical protein